MFRFAAVIVGVIAAMPALAAGTGVLAPAAEGKLQCYAPNVGAKRCRALSSYTVAADGNITNRATVMLSPAPLITMTTATPVTAPGDAVCGMIHIEDIDGASFTVGGKDATPDQTAAIRTQIRAALADRFGKKLCTAYIADGTGLRTKVSIDGAEQPDLSNEFVIWVAPGDGYSVGN